MNRKLTGIILAVMFLFTAVFAAAPADAKVLSPGDPGVKIVKFYIGQKYYDVNGVRQTMDVAPYVKDGRTLLPIRYVGYAMGLQEKDVDWNSAVRQASLKRWYGTGEYDYDEIVFRTGSDRSKADYILNGWDYTAKLDVPAEIAPPGRIMVPFRAAVHALGGLAFWDGKERSVTVVTWEKPPAPVKQTVKKVQCTLNKAEATVTYLDGTTKTVKTEKPAAISFTRPNGNAGYMMNAVEWLKLWGIPEDSMLLDPARGGLIVRGGAMHNNPLMEKDLRQMTTYTVFYVGEKQLWEGFFKRHPVKKEDLDKADLMYVKDGAFYGDCAVEESPVYLFGGSGWYGEKTSIGENWILIVGVEGSE